MKLQYIAVIFIIIIVPISLVLSEYLNVQIRTINNQTFYAKQLNDATYDTIKAFQFNTVHNRYSSVANSKLRDIKAATNTFFNTLGTTLTRSREDLQEYVPALAFTLYDGYYIYSRNRKTAEEEYSYELKPYIYYSCEYKSGSKRAIINYTLDNYITVYYYDGSEYSTKSGYLIDRGKVKVSEAEGTEENEMATKNVGDSKIMKCKISYDFIEIQNELLSEHLIFENGKEGNYMYIVYGNKKVYYDPKPDEIAPNIKYKYFWYDNNNKKYINDSKTKEYAENRWENGMLYSTSAKEYYINAYKFTVWVEENLGWITGDTVQNNNELKEQLGSTKIFKDIENPEQKDSDFNEHRMAVIKNSIQSNLITAISTYNTHANTYEYMLPQISEIDWYTITSKVCVMSFLQGIPIGTKYFNNYSVVSNSKNQEFIDKDSIYIVDKNHNSYHKIGCEKILTETEENYYMGYLNLNFVRQSIEVSDSDSSRKTNWFYPRQELGCYECTVSTKLYYTADDIISGNDIIINGKTYNKDNDNYSELRKKYITALAREKYDLYKSNNFGI